jgi:hypothetical protein
MSRVRAIEQGRGSAGTLAINSSLPHQLDFWTN